MHIEGIVRENLDIVISKVNIDGSTLLMLVPDDFDLLIGQAAGVSR